MQILLVILAILVLAIVVIIALAARRPDHFMLRRSMLIAASPDKIFPLINRFSEWSRWSPWDRLDPTMQKTLSGPSEGVGSVYVWKGNGKAGAGRMEITTSDAAREIGIALSFTAPMKAENQTRFTFQPQGAQTLVEWSMSGQMKLMKKIFDLLFNMDRLVGKDFEKGLAALKAEAERA